MKVLGFRGDPKAPRYAVVSEVGGAYTLENAASDNKLSVPASIGEDADAERLDWLYREVLAIFDAHPGIAKVMIKQNEYTQSDTKAKRKSAHADAAVVLACAHRGIPVELKIYSSMPTTSKDTKQHAETRVGKTDKYWDNKMSTAVQNPATRRGKIRPGGGDRHHGARAHHSAGACHGALAPWGQNEAM